MDNNKTVQAVEEKKPIRKGFFKSAKARLFALTMALASLMSMSAFAADGETTTSGFSAVWGSFDDLGTLMTKVWSISDATTTVPSVMSLVWSVMTANPLMSFFIIAAIVSVGFRFIRRGIKAVR